MTVRLIFALEKKQLLHNLNLVWTEAAILERKANLCLLGASKALKQGNHANSGVAMRMSSRSHDGTSADNLPCRHELRHSLGRRS